MLLNSPSTIHSQLSAARGMRHGSGARWDATWTPADITNLAAFFWFKPGVGSCFTDVAGTVAAVAGDPIKNVTGLYGASVLKATEATNPPTLRTDGMELDAAGVNLLSLSAALPGTGAFTVYASWKHVSGSSVVAMLSDTGQGSLLGSGSGNAEIYDNTTTYNLGIGIAPDVNVLFRFSYDGSSDYSVIATGQAEIANSGLAADFTFNQIGGTGAITVGNDSTGNRYNLLIYVDRVIVLGSAEDLLIRQWITDNCAVSL